MNYGNVGMAMLPVTGMGIMVGTHNVVLGTVIAVASGLIAAGCICYRIGTRGRRINVRTK